MSYGDINFWFSNDKTLFSSVNYLAYNFTENFIILKNSFNDIYILSYMIIYLNVIDDDSLKKKIISI